MADINTEEVFKKLKKQHGETFAKIMRGDEDHAGDLCAIPNILHILEFAGRDPNEARQLRKVIQELYSPDKKSIKIPIKTTKDPLQLLSDAGYEAFVVKTEQQKNSIMGYYRSGEKLCTFGDPERHIRYYTIHAIKKEVLGDDRLPGDQWHIKPSKTPKREDEYGTSVISIQIAKTGGYISIKNRYNHTVANPDATFGNNPDNIIPGLSYALKEYFHVDFKTTKTPLPDNFRMVNDQLVRFNYEINNIYFDSNYYFSGSTITKLKDDGSQLLFYKGFMLNISHDNSHIVSIAGAEQGFCDALNKYIRGKKIKVTGAKGSTKTILLDGERFMDVTDGQITFINAPTIIHAPLAKSMNPEQSIDLSGDLDFSKVDYLNLKGLYLKNATCGKFNPNADVIIAGMCLKLSGDLDFSGVKYLDLYCGMYDSYTCVDFTDVTSIKFNPNADTIIAGNGLTLSGDLDFSGVRCLELAHDYSFVDMKNVTSIKFNPNADVITVGLWLKLSGSLDFSGVKYLDLSHVSSLTNVTNIKFNPNADTIKVGDGLKISGDLDFSGVRHLELGFESAERPLSDLTNVTSIKCGPADTVKIVATALGGNLDFSRVHSLTIGGQFTRSYTDLTNVTGIKFNQDATASVMLVRVKLSGDLSAGNISFSNSDLTNVTSIKLNSESRIYGMDNILPKKLNISGGKSMCLGRDLRYVTSLNIDSARYVRIEPTTKLPNTMIFNNIESLSLERVDLTGVTNTKFSAQYVDFRGAKLSGNLDFSNVGIIDLTNADLSKVHSIKFNLNGEVRGLKPKDKLKFAFINGALAIKQTMSKVKKVVKKEDRTM